MSSGEMTFADWVSLGVERGWCSVPTCGSHDWLPVSEEEEAEFEEFGEFPCMTVVRLYRPDDDA
jgi:hypothetical protein